MHKKIYIVGTGMDGALTLTCEGEEAVKNADLLIGAQRMLKPFEELKKPCLCEYQSEIIANYIRNSDCEKIAVLMSGDCGFYSGAQKLLSLLSDMDTEVISGISSPVYFCSKIKIPWQGIHFSSLHGRNANAARLVSRYEKNFFILGGDVTVSQLCQRLCEYGLENVTVYVGENLSYENERIFSGSAKELADLQTEKLCVAAVINPQYENSLRTGIDDSEFIRDKVPMTKSEVRCAVVSKLEVGRDDICWDIGCGSGSVSVEMAMQCENGTVYAVDKNETAVRLTEQNSRRFACDNIQVIEADAFRAAETLPVPNCAFIGGSGGELEKIINSAYNKNNSVKLVVTAVSLETLTNCMNIFDKLGMTAEITQIAVTRTKKIGSYTMLSAENPVYIIKRKIP
ncbi:MAG: precorrin-6y C5,15-methyltransferase (decarboxylating) subunit CbiE [Oscillospiraceae bacterium]|nr:precorrin-6y C5,15-methyltransferase (decarboxylating) subunit CbiE [Oscillospiraceae bacterium]